MYSPVTPPGAEPSTNGLPASSDSEVCFCSSTIHFFHPIYFYYFSAKFCCCFCLYFYCLCKYICGRLLPIFFSLSSSVYTGLRKCLLDRDEFTIAKESFFSSSSFFSKRALCFNLYPLLYFLGCFTPFNPLTVFVCMVFLFFLIWTLINNSTC